MDIVYSSQKYIEQLETNSQPLYIVDKELQLYCCKTFSRHYRKKLIFVEFFCYYVLDMLRYSTPEAKIMIVENNHLEGSLYVSNVNTITKFLASKIIDDSILLDNINKSTKSYKRLPIRQIIEIAFFDYIFYNVDRNSNNSNLLISKDRFYAIDNAQCFNISEEIIDFYQEALSPEESIFSHPIIKILLRNNSKDIKNIANIVISEFLTNVDNIFDVFELSVTEFNNHFGDGVDYNWYRNCLKNTYLNSDRIKHIIQIFLEDIRG